MRLLSQLLALFLVWITLLPSSADAAGLLRRSKGADARCDQWIPAIGAGYGAGGSFAMYAEKLDQPNYRVPVEVFLPHNAPSRSPVVFFSHAYGPNRSEVYTPFMQHMVSRGFIVVYAPYPMVMASNEERYAKLWEGFLAAVGAYGHRMDLNYVGFVGHSFGGGAVPSMAYQGIVQQGWGRQGAFLMSLAPWYSFNMNPEKFAAFPKHVVNMVEVFDQDTINDHRMAIDQYQSMRLPANYFLMVHSEERHGCALTADHSLPGRSESLQLKRYALFRPFDAVVDLAFNRSSEAKQMLDSFYRKEGGGSYQPVEGIMYPRPIQPESYYTFEWSSDKNPRR